jgi:hypothetical protein
MPSVFLSRNSFNQLKRAAREQLPGVQHAHVLESLACALGHNNLAALKERLATGEDNAPQFFQFSYDDLRIRLMQLGYANAVKWDLDFSGVTDVFRVKRPFPSTLDALLADGIISLEQRGRLDQLIDRRKSILIIGTTSSGKSLLMHVLLNEMAVRAPRDEFLVCEMTRDGGEYPPNVTRFVESEHRQWERPHIGHRRVAIDEIRDDFSARAFDAWIAYGGGVGTMYARRTDEVLPRLAEILSGGRRIEVAGGAIDVVVRMERVDKPRVVEIVTRAELENPSEPPEFSQEWHGQPAFLMPSAEEERRYALNDHNRIVTTRFPAGELIPWDAFGNDGWGAGAPAPKSDAKDGPTGE